MVNAYIQLAMQGRTQLWRYILGAFFSLFCFLVGSSVTLFLLFTYIEIDGNPATQVLPPEMVPPGQLPLDNVPPLWMFIVANLSFPFFLLGIYLSLRWLHQRTMQSLITPFASISWRRIWQGFSVFFLIKSVEILISYLLSPTDFTFNFQPASFFIFVPFVLLLTPIQTATEELFFRGYLLQGIGYRFGKWVAVIGTSLLFMLLHTANPEVSTQLNWTGVASLIGYYFMTGVFLSWLTLKDGTLELALGVHAANNIATFLLVTSANSVVPSPALLALDKIEANFSLVLWSAVGFWIFSFIVFRYLRRPRRAGE